MGGLLVGLAVAALFLGPLWATGELGVWSFEEPRSHLVWDEAGGAAPRPADEPGGWVGLVAQLVVGPLLLGLAWSIRAVLASRADRAAGHGRRLAP
jgi:hypothetical protein